MRPGDVIDDRFDVLELASAGGMGRVYRAADRTTGETVALKVLHGIGTFEDRRFVREAETLAALRLPGVVRHIAHGVMPDGNRYLVMEWLTGSTLGKRLRKGALSLEECLVLGERVAATLGAIHARGLVHRDLKPSNLLLVADRPEQVTLIDFGIVRRLEPEQEVTLTKTGAVIGTPGYMAPEQARGEREIDARADVFSLGCLLHECLTGRPAFEGRGLALLALLVLHTPPPVAALRPEVPRALDGLIGRMLAKAPEERPRDASVVAAELAGIALTTATERASGPRSAATHERSPAIGAALTGHERRVLCLVVTRAAVAAPNREATTRDEREVRTRERELTELSARFGGEIALLDGREPLIIFTGGALAMDLAARAARCALSLSEHLDGAPVAVATGCAARGERAAELELIDRAMRLIAQDEDLAGAPVRLDEVTAGLLGARFEIARTGACARLRRVRADLDVPVGVFGATLPCVGRERELAMLHAGLNHCLEESSACAVLITGDAGLGKSRLRHELIAGLREREALVQLWCGKGDAMSAGSPFALLGDALRNAFGLRADEPPAARREKILERVARHAASGIDVRHVAAFLGEILGAPFPDETTPKLAAGRRSPVQMSDHIREAWEHFVRAECEARPVVLVLEDLNWGDLPTVSLVDAALRVADALPLFVLALGRPEVDRLFPKLWEQRALQRLRLKPLSRRACERVVHQALGERAAPALVAQLVERADGNAFFLEEQIRAVVEVGSHELPETVLATILSRLEALGERERRALRAASVFGETFRESGVAALLGGADVAPDLAELTRRELLFPIEGPSTRGDVELRFRHGLLREAAYGMLTVEDRRLGHALAGDLLARDENADPLVLAEHFERGGAGGRAAAMFLSAAKQALFGNDLPAAIERAERGITHARDDATVGALRLVQAEAHLWRGDMALAEAWGVEALRLLERGTADWFRAVQYVFNATGQQGAIERGEPWLIEALAAEGALAEKSGCLAECAAWLVVCGRFERADAILAVLERSMETCPAALGARVAAKINEARAFRLLPADDPEALIAAFEAALASFEEIGDRRNACNTRTNLGLACAQIGDYGAADAMLRAALSTAERLELHPTRAFILHNLGLVLARSGRLDEGRAAELAALESAYKLGATHVAGGARLYLALIALLRGDPEDAEREAGHAMELLQAMRPLRGYAVALKASALLGLGRSVEALALAREARSCLNEPGNLEEGGAFARLVHAEALAANDLCDEARAAIESARATLLQSADKLRDPLRRARFLEAVHEHRRTLELARAWSAEPPAPGTD